MEATLSAPGAKLAVRGQVKSLAGTFVGRYRLDALLGQGGFGEVWKGYDPELNRAVAVKVERCDRQVAGPALIRLLDEARKAASMSHPGIVPVYDIAHHDGGSVIVSEYIEGETLSDRMKRESVSIDFAVRTVITIAQALHHAHVRDVIHRDVKPGNILLRTNGSAMLTDFGLALSENELIGQSDSLSGTIRYMSPEQARGGVAGLDHRSDLFSLGLVFYAMLAGRLPYPDSGSDSYLKAVATRAPRPLGSVVENLPTGLESICMKCLAFSPEGRYSTCRELAEALEDWQRNYQPGVVTSGSQTVPVRSIPVIPNKTRRIALFAGLAATMMLAGIIIPRMKQYVPGPAIPKPANAAPIVEAPLQTETPHSPPTSPVAVVPEGANDAIVPILSLTDAWIPLLKSMPQQVAWSTSDGREPPRFDVADQRLSVKSPRSRWVFQCAEVDSQPLRLRLLIAIDRWEGYAGVVWGLREEPDSFPEVRYRCLGIEYLRSGPREPAKLVARNMMLKRHSFDDIRILRQGTLVETIIPLPTEYESTLEVDVHPDGPVVRFGTGSSWRVTEKLSETDWLPDGRWAIGLTGQGLGVSVRSYSLRNLPGAKQ